MGSIWLPNAKDIAVATGFPVVEMSGWQTRSNSHGGFDQLQGITVHHTASGKSSDGAGDASYIATGSDSAPISNYYISRNGTIYVIAAGSCNHGGKGGPYSTPLGTIPQDKVNFRAISIEIGNTGTGEVWPNDQINSSAQLCAKLMNAFGWTNANVVFAHKEWCGPGTSTPGRKIDPFGPWASGKDWGLQQGTIDVFRNVVEDCITDALLPDDEDDDMARAFVRHGAPGSPNWNAFICFSGGKFWIPTMDALARVQSDFGYEPLAVDKTYMEATGPVIGPNPTNNSWGVVE